MLFSGGQCRPLAGTGGSSDKTVFWVSKSENENQTLSTTLNYILILIIATLLLESFSAGTKKGQIKIIGIF